MRTSGLVGLGLVAVVLASCGNTGTATDPDPDLTPPTVAITAPLPGAVVDTVVIEATALDDHEVVSVAFRVNGGVVLHVDSVAPYTYSWDTSTYGVGRYDWQAIAQDAARNTTTSAPVRYTIGL